MREAGAAYELMWSMLDGPTDKNRTEPNAAKSAPRAWITAAQPCRIAVSLTLG